jgi:transmembrane 9 superfamily protein 1
MLGSSTGFFVMMYGVFYFKVRSNMSGLLQVGSAATHSRLPTGSPLPKHPLIFPSRWCPARLQTVQFFGYTSMACYAFFLMLGTVGFYSSLYFVRYMYKNVKLD